MGFILIRPMLPGAVGGRRALVGEWELGSAPPGAWLQATCCRSCLQQWCRTDFMVAGCNKGFVLTRPQDGVAGCTLQVAKPQCKARLQGRLRHSIICRLLAIGNLRSFPTCDKDSMLTASGHLLAAVGSAGICFQILMPQRNICKHRNAPNPKGSGAGEVDHARVCHVIDFHITPATS